MKVLVIGGSGLLGAAVSERLGLEGADVVCVSRGGDAPAGRALGGDVRLPALGLRARDLSDLRDGLSHIVSCFGSVSWSSGPRQAIDTQRDGMRNIIQFAESCAELERLVHVSSVLVFGNSRRTVGNRDLDVGQRFNNWYEYGKFLEEEALRRSRGLPWRIIRLGPILGVRGPVAPSADDGLLATLPFLLRGYPIHLNRGGAFASYVGESTAAAAVIAQACHSTGTGDTWTWYDERSPTLAQVLTELCAPWHVVPRLVSSKLARPLSRLLAPGLGLPRPVSAYGSHWVRLDSAVLADLPGPPPQCPEGYCRTTGEYCKRSSFGVSR